MKKKLAYSGSVYLFIVIISYFFSSGLALFLICFGAAISTVVVLALLLNNEVKKTVWFKSIIPNLNNYPTNEWYREHEERNYDVVNIGSSSAKHAFDYSGLGIKTFNWAEQPQSLSYGFKILKTYFSILKRNGVVIISLGPFSGLDVDGKWRKETNDKYYYLLDPALIDDFRSVKIRRNYPLIADPIRSMKELVKNILKKRPDTKKISVGFEDNSDRWIKGWLLEFGITDLEAGLSQENKKGREKRIKLLSDIINFCIERDLKPVIVIPPMHPTLSSKFSETFRENYIYSFIWSANSENAPFMNYIDDMRFAEDRLFKNSFFLNETGAKQFTSIVLHDLELI